MTTVTDMTGLRFGHLTVLERSGSDSVGRAVWRYVCDCGRIKTARGKDIRQGLIIGCGNHKVGNLLHGGKWTTEYRSWQAMKNRCSNPKDIHYSYYGGRGIKVCDRWLNSFENFLEDMGKKPTPNHSIDRINNNGNYEPGNCRWATASEQAYNRRPKRKENT